MKKIFPFLFLFIGFNICKGQVKYYAPDSIHIFWHRDLKLTFSDYREDSVSEKYVKFMEKFNSYAFASVGIGAVLDIPEKEKDRYKKFEKFYFLPSFDRSKSYAKTKDTLLLYRTIFLSNF